MKSLAEFLYEQQQELDLGAAGKRSKGGPIVKSGKIRETDIDKQKRAAKKMLGPKQLSLETPPSEQEVRDEKRKKEKEAEAKEKADKDAERKEERENRAQEARDKAAAREKMTDRKTGVRAGLKRELGGDFIGVRASEEEKEGLKADKDSDEYKKAEKEKEERERQNRAAREKAFGRAIKRLGRGAGSVSDALKSTVTKGEVSQEGGQTTGGSKLTSRRKDG